MLHAVKAHLTGFSLTVVFVLVARGHTLNSQPTLVDLFRHTNMKYNFMFFNAIFPIAKTSSKGIHTVPYNKLTLK